MGGFIKGGEYTDLADQLQALRHGDTYSATRSVGRFVNPLQINVRLTWIIYNHFLVPRSKHTPSQL